MKIRDYLIQQGAKPEKADVFLRYHQANPQVWKAFETIALRLVKDNRQGYGSMAILNIARWESDVRGLGDFKINNNAAPFYSRVFALKHPEHKDFFEFREFNSKG